MAKKEIIKLKKVLSKALKDKGISVSQIILFGSSAKGKAREDSDIDIIIVSKDFRNKDIFEKAELTRGIHRELVKQIMRPFDILYYSDVDWRIGHSLIIHAAKIDGQVIY
jgi:predicted nucleotidyltransferase